MRQHTDERPVADLRWCVRVSRVIGMGTDELPPGTWTEELARTSVSDNAPASRCTVVSIDNGSFAEGGLRTKKREFDDSQEAMKYAQGLIDGALNQHFGAAESAHELMTLYAISGSDVPKIYGEPHVDFHAYRYAREKADAMFALPAN